jgi:hypothetical protein
VLRAARGQAPRRSRSRIGDVLAVPAFGKGGRPLSIEVTIFPIATQMAACWASARPCATSLGGILIRINAPPRRGARCFLLKYQIANAVLFSQGEAGQRATAKYKYCFESGGEKP